MTTAPASPSADLVGDGHTVRFAIPFPMPPGRGCFARITDSGAALSGHRDGSDYVMDVAPAAAAKFTLYGKSTISQLRGFANVPSVTPKRIEDALDLLTSIGQELGASADQALNLGFLAAVGLADVRSQLVSGVTLAERLPNRLAIGAYDAPAGTRFLTTDLRSTSSVMNDSQLTTSGVTAYTDSGATRAAHFIYGAANGYVNHTAGTLARAGEFQTIRGPGTINNGTWGIEIGVHNQVAATGGNLNLGAYIASSHAGWLSSGLVGDDGVLVCGEDGWNRGFRHLDVDGATNLFYTGGGGGFFKRSLFIGTASGTAAANVGCLTLDGPAGSLIDLNYNGSRVGRLSGASATNLVLDMVVGAELDVRSNGADQFAVVGTAGATSRIVVSGSTGNAPSIGAGGAASNIDLTLQPQGQGRVVMGGPLLNNKWVRATVPSPSVVGQGAQIYVQDASAPYWSDGTTWRTAGGVAL